MGLSSLRELAVIETTSYDAIPESVIAVDALNWLYRYLTITVRFTDASEYTTTDGTEVPNIIGIVQGLPKFFENGLLPVFVFDGGVIDLKRDEMRERRARRKEAAEQAAAARGRGDEVAAARHAARAQELTDVIFQTTRELFDLFDVSYVDAPLEGEAQAAHMARVGDAEYVGSEDYDVLLFGAPLTLRKLTSRDEPECMDLEATLAEHDITREQLVDIAILCGTDYNDGLHGYGPTTALTKVKQHGDLDSVLQTEQEHIDHADRIRSLYLDPAVTDDYAFNTTVEPDLEGIRHYVTETWEIPGSTVDRAFERLADSTPFSL